MPFDKNTKFFSSPIIYQGRGVYINGGKTYKPIAIDVRHFIQVNDFFLDRIVKEEGIWDLPDNDSIALACLRFVRKHIKYTPDKEQMGVDEFWTFPNETLALGKGDCFAGYEEIYTQNGIKRIDELKVGDIVLSYDFEKKEYVYKPIVAAWEKDELEINRVYFRNGQWMDVSENHPMWCRYSQKHSNYEKRYLSSIDLTRWWKRKVPIAKKIPYQIKDMKWLTDDLCVVLGHFLAEGWIRPRVNVPHEAWTSGSETNTHIIPILEKYDMPYKTRINGSGVTCLRFLEENFASFLCKQLTNSFDIHLEEKIFHLPESKLDKILYGYWLGDGTKNLGKGDKRGFKQSREAVYSTSSKQFAADIQRIGLQIGKTFHIQFQKNHGGAGKKPIYRITYNPVSFFLQEHGYKDVSEVSIKKIERLEKTKMYDITVADTHTVIMKNGIITHQCDDGSILLASLMRNAGIPASKIRVCAGWVDAGKNAPLGGHAYTIYKASDGEFRVLDWCYLPNDLPVLQRLPYYQEPRYKDIWFTFNDKGSWSKNRIPTTIFKSCRKTSLQT
jgi:hypothetical protein